MVSAFLHPFAKPTRADFVTLVRGEGSLVFDSHGKQYIDAMASLWYCAVGHGRREIADAIKTQAETLAAYSTFDPFTNAPAESLAHRLAQLSPLPDSRIFFTSSGSESVDTAMKIARLTHVRRGNAERTLIISRERGYHGTNYGGTSAQGIPPNREGYGPLVGDVVQVPADDVEALASVMARNGDRVAAVLIEPLQGAGGVFPPTEGYLESVRRLCDQHGALLIFDEVITAFGRLGSWFAAEHYQVEPDMITFAKAVTSGYQPLGGIVIGPRVREVLESDESFFLRTGFTYSGHPTACAAALVNLDILENENLLQRALAIGARLSNGLRSIENDALVASVRGEGCVWAIAHHPETDPVAVRDAMLERGVITRAIGSDTNTFCPPFVTTDDQIDRIIDTLVDVLGK
ncbi:MAG: aspartate aminotransferase family protein [Actinomycetota bacterium]